MLIVCLHLIPQNVMQGLKALKELDERAGMTRKIKAYDEKTGFTRKVKEYDEMNNISQTINQTAQVAGSNVKALDEKCVDCICYH